MEKLVYDTTVGLPRDTSVGRLPWGMGLENPPIFEDPGVVIITARKGTVRKGANTPGDALRIIVDYLDDGYELGDLDWLVKQTE